MAVSLIICVVLSRPVLAQVTIPSITAPPGATMQLRIEMLRPQAIASGSFTVSLDPQFFGPIRDLQVFSAAGDALGTVSLNGSKAEVEFSSAAGGVGRVIGLPVATISTTILPTVGPGAEGSVAFTAADWKDFDGNAVNTSDTQGVVTAGGRLSLGTVTAIAKATRTYRVSGTGFRPDSRVTSPSMPLATTAYRSPGEFEITLSGAAELTGQSLQVENPDHERAKFIYAVETIPDPSDRSTFRPLLPLRTFTSMRVNPLLPVANGITSIALENPHPTPVDLTIEQFDSPPFFQGRTTRVIPARGRLFLPLRSFGFKQRGGSGGLISSKPIRALSIYTNSYPPDTVMREFPPYRSSILAQEPFIVPPNVAFEYQVGSPRASSMDLRLTPNNDSFAAALPATVVTDTPWLSVTTREQAAEGVDVEVRLNPLPLSLAPGDYAGAVTVIPSDPALKPQRIPVTLAVRTQPFIDSSMDPSFIATPGQTIIITRRLSTSSRGAGVSVPITLRAEGGPWLNLSTTVTTTDAGAQLLINPAGLAIGVYEGRVFVTGPANSIVVPVSLTVAPLPAVATLEPSAINVVLPTGPNARYRTSVFAKPFGAGFSAVLSTDSGASWLAIDGVSTSGFNVSLDGTRLAPGVYLGTVKVVSVAGNSSLTIPVKLTIVDEMPAIRITPEAPESLGPTVSFTVSAPGDPVVIQVNRSSIPTDCTLSPGQANQSQYLTPVQFTITCSGALGRISIAMWLLAAGRPITVPVVVRSLPSLSPAMISTVTHSATNAAAPIAPGQIITIHGAGSNRRVTFNNLNAPVLAETVDQANVLVPTALTGKTATIRIDDGEPTTVPLASAAPGIFTLDGTGLGQGTILNQDNSLNGPSHPAVPGSIVQIFATGGGRGDLATKIQIAGTDAQVVFAGAIGNGLCQINAVVPIGAAPNPAAEVTLQIGEFLAGPGITLAIR